MNREIKFRLVYTDQNGKKYLFYSENKDYLIGLDGVVYENYGKSWKEPMWETVFDADAPPILQQYTGFKDDTGKEIYDGDVIEYDDKSTRLVRWTIEGTWEEAPLDTNYCKGFDINDSDGYIGCNGYDEASLSWSGGSCNGPILVIGNIFENPELVKQS